ncbi:lipoprotein 17-related variable surface protein [Mycoplasmopsis agassizii]|uniref:lipoprotein 17-related variable surface protein n=1 Tax=Mycoplasmopsis agassizii TaxID=33922 RepID=UPI003529C138
MTVEELKSLFTAPTSLTGSTVEVEKVANGDNDVAGNLKLKVTLKQGDNFFKEDGSTVLEAEKATAGKTVTISGFVASDANAAKASTWYETKVQDQHVEEIEALKTKKPSEVSATTDKAELDKLFALPTGEGAFNPEATIEYSDLKANDYTGSLSLKVALKVGTEYYDKSGNKVTAAAGETVELTGFADYKTQVAAWYTAVANVTLGDSHTELKAKAASAATNDEIKALFTAPSSETLPNSEFSVSLTADDAAGTVSVKVVFSATVDGTKYNFNANGSLDESETASGKTVTVSGFKVDTTKADVTSWYTDTVKDTTVTTTELTAKKPSEVVTTDLTSLFTAPTTVAGSSVELELVQSGASDSAGTLKVKVYLKQGDQFYTSEGNLVTEKTTAGKEVTLSGFKNTSQELEAKAKTWYETLPSTFAADTESAKKLASEFKDETAIKGLIDKMTDTANKAKFTAPEGFTVSYSFVSVEDVTDSGNTTTTLKFKALLKNGESSFDGTTGKITTETDKGKEVSVTGFTSEQVFALKIYKELTTENLRMTLDGSTNTEATALKEKMASQVTADDFANLNTALKAKLDSLNSSYEGTGFKIEIIKKTTDNFNNAAGALQVQFLLSSTDGTTTKYWKLTTTNQSAPGEDATVEAVSEKTAATGRDADVTGFKTGVAYLSPLLESFVYKDSFATTDEENIKKLSNVFKTPTDADDDTRLETMIDALNALKATSQAKLDKNAVIGYSLSTTANDNKWTVAPVEIDGKLVNVSGQFKLTSGENSATESSLNIKGTSDLAEFSPHFMSVKVPSNGVTTSGNTKNVELSVENFETYEKWKTLLNKVETLWGENTDADKAKLDIFSNALGEKMVEAGLAHNGVESATRTFYVTPFPISELPTDSYSLKTDNSQTVANSIGSNKDTLILGGWSDWTPSGNTNPPNGKPYNKTKQNGVSQNYFQLDNVKWYFNGFYTLNQGPNTETRVGGETISLFGAPSPVAHAEEGTSGTRTPRVEQYPKAMSVAIRFLLEAIITNDTMSRTPAEATEATPSEPAGNTGENNS